MSPREAVHILMLSPLYFYLDTVQRWELVREYCRNMQTVHRNGNEFAVR